MKQTSSFSVMQIVTALVIVVAFLGIGYYLGQQQQDATTIQDKDVAEKVVDEESVSKNMVEDPSAGSGNNNEEGVPEKSLADAANTSNGGEVLKENDENMVEDPAEVESDSTHSENNKDEVAEKKEVDLSVYEQWKMPEDYKEYAYSKWETTDCILTMNGETGGGDLLSTLIVEKALWEKFTTRIYTPAYIQALEQRIAKTLGHNFYASSVCHISDDLDVLTGAKTSKGEGRILVIAQKDAVREYANVRLFDQTATGGEVEPCDARLDGEYVIWHCFTGLLHDYEINENIGEKWQEWKISLNGGKPTVREGEITW